jgi:hypothetical protein
MSCPIRVLPTGDEFLSERVKVLVDLHSDFFGEDLTTF